MGFFSRFFSSRAKPGKPQNLNDSEFESEVISGHLPAVVDFWSPRCPPCQVMSGLLAELGPQYVDRVNIFKMNVEQNPVWATRFQIRGVPTLVFVRDGKVVDSVVGLLPMNPLKKKFERLTR